jgi:hypothetical protein
MEGQGSRTLLLEALQALYHHPDPQIRTAANRWLDEFQHTMEAWQAWLQKPSPLPPHGIFHIGFDVEVLRSIRYFFRNITSTLA